MGLVNSTEATNIDNGKIDLIQKATEDLSSVTANNPDRPDDHVRCVKARIDMLIEDCLNLETYTSSEGNQTSTSATKSEPSGTTTENESKATGEQSDLIKNYLGVKEVAIKVETGSKDCDDEKQTGELSAQNTEKENSSKPEDVQTQSNDKQPSKTETEQKGGKMDQMKVSDIIHEMVSTEINQTHLAQLQKRTITTFNTFIDKVLDTTLHQELNQEENPSEPSIIQLFTDSLLPAKKEAEKSEQTTGKTNEEATVVEPKTERKISLKDHIEKLLEKSIQNDTDHQETTKKEIKMGKFNAQGLLNNIIVQSINDSRNIPKSESQWPRSDSHSPKVTKPVEKHSKVVHQDRADHRQQRSPGMNPRRESNEIKMNRMAQKEQELAEARYKEMCMKSAGRPDGRNDPRDLYNSYSGRRHSMSERSREAMMMNAGNKHMPGNVRNAENPSVFTPLHPVYATDYYKNAYAAVSGSHGHTPDTRAYPHRDGKRYHPRDCVCTLCLQAQHRNKLEQGDSHHDKPNVPPHLAAMMRGGVGLAPGYPPYQGSTKLLPPHQPLISPKDMGAHLAPPGEIHAQGMVPGHRLNVPENPNYPLYQYKRTEDKAHLERQLNKSGPPHMSMGRPAPGPRPREKDYPRTLSSHSSSSDSSDAPLDLSVKKTQMLDPSRHRSASFTAVGHQQKRIDPSNSFIKHLENSVDKHWQDICSPSNSPSNSSSPKMQHLAPDNRAMGQHSMSRGHSPNPVSPSGSVAMLHNRHLPSPHFAGGITVGQPLVNLERNTAVTPEAQYPPSSQYENFPASKSQFQGNQQTIESNRSADNISKHEPIQNIIGNHDTNDILYLICRLCAQTYGSPYAFRKHFRSVHGFEPRAEHTVVQTISATKMAMHLPQPQDIQMSSQARKSPHEKMARLSPQGAVSPKKPMSEPVKVKTPVSPVESTKSQSTCSDEIDMDIDIKQENTGVKNETKCLECPECGKSFQLNDFGSYKRHCRQHGNSLTSGPFTCTDCHLHFPDQKLLREHYLMHVKEAPLDQKDVKKLGDPNLVEIKSESHQTCYSCVKCHMQFDSMGSYTTHMAAHNAKDDKTPTKPTEKFEKPTTCAMDIKAQVHMDISVNIGTTPSIVRQAAESMTAAQMCPDSSWDNVVKGVATSNKPDEVVSESKSSPKLYGIKEERSENSPSRKGVDQGSDASDINTPDAAVDTNIYKHKKFFHHRKRANVSASEDASDAKQIKITSEINSVSNVPVSSSSKVLFSANTDSCDSSGFSDTGSTTSSVTDTTSSVASSAQDKKAEKTTKSTEARHNLPFVWDRPTRSQKKL